MRLPEQEARCFIALYSAMSGWCSGRLVDDSKMRGRIFVHDADDTGFVAEKVATRKRKRKSR